MQEKLKKWWRGFVDKQKLAVTDSDDGSEKWYMYISPARIILGFVSLVVLLFAAVALIVAYTPVMDTIPGYPGRQSREMLIRGIMRLDSLEREMANLTVYSDNIALIMEGKTPVIRNTSRIGDSIEVQDKTLVPPGTADSILRARMEGSGPYNLAASASAARTSGVANDLIPPAQGLVQTRFSPVNGRYGVEIATTSNHPVVAVRDGSVILSIWTPEEGYIMQIQHPDNLVSIYKRLSQPQHTVGERVRAGESIGVAGNTGEGETGVSGAGTGLYSPLVFELWYNGTPVDPESYIVF